MSPLAGIRAGKVPSEKGGVEGIFCQDLPSGKAAGKAVGGGTGGLDRDGVSEPVRNSAEMACQGRLWGMEMWVGESPDREVELKVYKKSETKMLQDYSPSSGFSTSRPQPFAAEYSAISLMISVFFRISGSRSFILSSRPVSSASSVASTSSHCR